MKIYSWFNFIIALIFTGWTIYDINNNILEKSQLIRLLIIILYYYFLSLTKDGYNLFEKDLNAIGLAFYNSPRKIAIIIFNMPVILLILAKITETIYPFKQVILLLFYLPALVIQVWIIGLGRNKVEY